MSARIHDESYNFFLRVIILKGVARIFQIPLTVLLS